MANTQTTWEIEFDAFRTALHIQSDGFDVESGRLVLFDGQGDARTIVAAFEAGVWASIIPCGTWPEEVYEKPEVPEFLNG